MIYTLTLNPAIDYIMKADNLTEGATNRSFGEEFFVGGKGINVSRMLQTLGVESVALGFVGGFTGAAIEDFLDKKGIATDFVQLRDKNSRINVKLKGAKETEINGAGPEIEEAEIETLLERLKGLSSGDVLVLSGSVPKGIGQDIYEKICALLLKKGVKTVVDATKGLLLNCLKYHPFLVKPNNFELEEMVQRPLKTEEEIVLAAKELQKMGAENVLVSMAEKGAILVTAEERVIKANPHNGRVINSVGAGDSMVAGFLAGLCLKKDMEYALRLGTAAGGATAFSFDLAEKEEIEALLKIKNKKL